MLSPHPFLRDQEIEPEEAQAPVEDTVVDLSQAPMHDMVDGALITGDLNGVVVDFEPEAGSQMPQTVGDHDENLAKYLIEGQLAQIAQTVCEWVETDLNSRSQWYSRLADGLQLLGVVHKAAKQEAFKLVENVTHPLIAEAAVQFQASASSELLPPGGPAKGVVLGEKTRELDAQAERVADYLNYQVTVQDPDHYLEGDKLLFMQALEGSQFKKVYHDELLDLEVSRWIRGEDFIVPYSAVSLISTPRYTHRQYINQNDMKRLQAGGYFREVQLTLPTGGRVVGEDAKLADSRDQAEGKTDGSSMVPEDAEHTVLECNCYFDLEGFEDKRDDGEPSGIALPYVISVDYDTQTTLSIRRNWKENDGRKKKRVNVVHYPYIPGEGFYSWGLIHLIGGLGEAATGLLQTIMLGAAFASVPGGYKSKDSKLPGNSSLEFGVFKEVDMTSEELERSFWSPDFQGPSESMFKVLGLVTDLGRRFASTTDQSVGDGSNTGPVGTTVALIEQGKKVFSGIHKRLHSAQAEELRMLMELDGEHVPPEGYPYRVPGADRQVFKEDFDDRVDVSPVSDPNVFSSTQRLAIAQTVVQRSDASPGMYDRRKAELLFLKALRVPDPEDVLTAIKKPQRCDPVTENAYLLIGKGIQAFVDQNHDAHIAVHMDQMRRLEAENSPLLDRVATPSLDHVAEHTAHRTRVQMFAQMGIPMPPADFEDGEEEGGYPQMSPEIENQIAARAALAVQQLPPPPGDEKAQQLQQQAAELQKQAEALAGERQQVEGLKEEAEKSQAAAKAAQRELALRSQIEALKGRITELGAGNARQQVLEAAVRRVEGALTKTVQGKR